MKFLRLSTFMAISLSAVAGTFLFSTAQKVQQTQEYLTLKKVKVEQEKQAIRVLQAEWDYLNRPDRLEALVERNLELIPVDSDAVRADAANLPDVRLPIIPARKPDFSAPQQKQNPSLQAIPAVLNQPSALQFPAPKPAPPSPPQEPSRKDFQKLLHDLSPAAGGDE